MRQKKQPRDFNEILDREPRNLIHFWSTDNLFLVDIRYEVRIGTSLCDKSVRGDEWHF